MLWLVPWLILTAAVAATSSTVWEQLIMHKRSNFLDLEFSSESFWSTGMLFDVQTVSALYKTFVPHKISTTIPGIFAAYLLDHLLPDLPDFWQNLTFSHCSHCDILDFCHSQTTTLQNSDGLSYYTTHNCILLG
jgi:hypothetical protein